jgi:DNA-binding CsgD family transcriptional regulator
LRGESEQARTLPNLTDREREVLVWACRGKTRTETAELLNIGERTVEFHFENAMKKLGVFNKFHAIAVAIHLGLISP